MTPEEFVVLRAALRDYIDDMAHPTLHRTVALRLYRRAATAYGEPERYSDARIDPGEGPPAYHTPLAPTDPFGDRPTHKGYPDA